MQWIKTSRFKIFGLVLTVLGLVGLLALLEFFEFFGDRQSRTLSASVAGLELPDSAWVERFDFDGRGEYRVES